MTRYIFKNKDKKFGDIEEYETDDRSMFEDFIQAHTTDALVRMIQEFGIRERLTWDEPSLDKLIEYICDGDYEDMAGGDLFAEGMDAMVNDATVHDIHDFFDCISIREDEEEEDDRMGNDMKEKLEEFRRQLEKAKESGLGFMMVGTDDPKEAAEIMRIASEVLSAQKKETTEVGYALGKNYEETEFDTTDEDELARRWWEYCKKNDLICVIRKEDEEDDDE